jgi:hypothetical protein
MGVFGASMRLSPLGRRDARGARDLIDAKLFVSARGSL